MGGRLESKWTDSDPGIRPDHPADVADPESMDGKIILCGASVRSLAQAAIREGLQPLCIDFFGDRDLQAVLSNLSPASDSRQTWFPDGGRHCVISSFRQLPQILSALPHSIPLVWSGGLENDPQLLEQIAAERPIAGAAASAVRLVRNPFRLAAWMHEAGCCFPRTDNNPRNGWLRKPFRSAGGSDIRQIGVSDAPAVATSPAETDDPVGTSEFYFQELVDGIPMSATFVSDGRAVCLLGIMIQLIGWSSLRATGFQFCGNLGPVQIPFEVSRELTKAADAIVSKSRLCGVFGIDFILSDRGTESFGDTGKEQPCGRWRPWIIEINPRISASHEMIDWNSHTTVLQEHLSSCGVEVIDGRRQTAVANPGQAHQTDQHLRSWMRLVVFADHDTTADRLFPADSVAEFSTSAQEPAAGLCRTGPDSPTVWLADIPNPGQSIPAGAPICSVYVRMATPEKLRSEPDSVSEIQASLILNRLQSLPCLFLSGAGLNPAAVADQTRKIVHRCLKAGCTAT